jgi:hypothetical protein
MNGKVGHVPTIQLGTPCSLEFSYIRAFRGISRQPSADLTLTFLVHDVNKSLSSLVVVFTGQFQRPWRVRRPLKGNIQVLPRLV